MGGVISTPMPSPSINAIIGLLGTISLLPSPMVIFSPVLGTLICDAITCFLKMIILFNKPFNVVCQFSSHEKYPTLKNFIDIPNVYAAGRLDTDSEGLLILTDDGVLQHRLSYPTYRSEEHT